MWTTQRLPATDSTPVMSSSTPSPSPPTTSPSQSVIRIAALNVWSLRHKYVQVSDLITAAELDIIAVTESWHSTSEDVAVRRAAPPGFSFIDRPRSQVGLHETDVNGPRGGIVVYYRSHLTAKKIDIRIVTTTFEAVAISLSTRRGPVTALAPPPHLQHSSMSYRPYWSNLLCITLNSSSQGILISIWKTHCCMRQSSLLWYWTSLG